MAGVGHCVHVSLPSDAPFGYLRQCIWRCAREFAAVSLTVNMTLCTPHLPPLPVPNSLSTSGCASVSALVMPIPVAALLFVLSRVEVICGGSSVVEVSRLSVMKLSDTCQRRRFSCGGKLHSRKATRALQVLAGSRKIPRGKSEGIPVMYEIHESPDWQKTFLPYVGECCFLQRYAKMSSAGKGGFQLWL